MACVDSAIDSLILWFKETPREYLNLERYKMTGKASRPFDSATEMKCWKNQTRYLKFFIYSVEFGESWAICALFRVRSAMLFTTSSHGIDIEYLESTRSVEYPPPKNANGLSNYSSFPRVMHSTLFLIGFHTAYWVVLQQTILLPIGLNSQLFPVCDGAHWMWFPIGFQIACSVALQHCMRFPIRFHSHRLANAALVKSKAAIVIFIVSSDAKSISP